MSPLFYDAVAIPLSLAALAGVLLYFRYRPVPDVTADDSEALAGPEAEPAAPTMADLRGGGPLAAWARLSLSWCPSLWPSLSCGCRR